jgi:hypothetical protein
VLSQKFGVYASQIKNMDPTSKGFDFGAYANYREFAPKRNVPQITMRIKALCEFSCDATRTEIAAPTASALHPLLCWRGAHGM